MTGIGLTRSFVGTSLQAMKPYKSVNRLWEKAGRTGDEVSGFITCKPIQVWLHHLYLSLYFCSFIFSSYLSDEIEDTTQGRYLYNHNSNEEIYSCMAGLYGH